MVHSAEDHVMLLGRTGRRATGRWRSCSCTCCGRGAAADVDISKTTLDIALDLITARNIDEVRRLLVLFNAT